MQNLLLESSFLSSADSLSTELLSAGVGANFFEEEVDEVLFHTNNFLSDSTFVGGNGPFSVILQASLTLGALFAIIYGANIAYKMMYKGEPFDPLKILKVVAISVIMSTWYADGGILDTLSVIPNSIGSWTKTLYDIEVSHVDGKFRELTPKIVDYSYKVKMLEGKSGAGNAGLNNDGSGEKSILDPEKNVKAGEAAAKQETLSSAAGIICLIDKIFFLLGIAMYRIGFWGTIFCQQICLGMLTIFGPIQWAFSLLPKWESAWAKWLARYMTIHFYGAMLYFVGFYVLLLFDVVFSIQLDQIEWILAVDGDGQAVNLASYIKVAFFTSIYMLVAGVVALKCLNLVPDLAAWMIPEGDTAFSTRNFGEGIAGAVKQAARV